MKTTTLADRQLIERFREGDTHALSVLIERHKHKVYTSIYLMVKDKSLAEDIFQDTFIKIIDRITDGRYVEEDKFIQWANRIARNRCIDHFRNITKRQARKEDTVFDIFERLDIPTDAATDERIVHEQRYNKLAEMLDQLNEAQREVIILRHYGGLSFKQIAEITNCSINTALGRMRYGLMNLRKMIEEKKLDL